MRSIRHSRGWKREGSRRFLRRAALLFGWVLTIGLAQADDEREDPNGIGGCSPLAPVEQLLAQARSRYPGRVLKLELEEEHGTCMYEVKWLTPAGNVLKLYYHARSLKLLRVKGRHDEEHD